MRAVFSLLFALALFAGGAFAQTQVVKTGSVVTQDNRLPGHEPDTYRFGIAYLSTRGTSPGQCEAACNRDANRCASWTLVPATFQMGPRCELKRNIGAQQYRPGSVSGITLRYQPKGNELQQAFERRSTVPQPRATYRSATPAPQPVTTRQVPIRRAPTSPSTSTVMTAPSGPAPALRGAPPPPPSSPVNLAPTPMDRPIPPIRVAPEPSMPAPAPQPVQPVKPERPPQFEMQPSSATPVPAPQPAPTPTRQIQPIRRSAAVPAPSPEPAPQPAAQPAPVATVPVEPSGGVQMDPPPPPIQPRSRTPWNERTGAETDYSVSDIDIIPGDEEATAGFIGGVPEE
ncbi:MAG: PAN domain-containing protein [Pseudomonadota bacterium]